MKQLIEGPALSHVLLADMKAGYTLQQIVDDMYARTGMLVVILNLNNRILLHAQCESAGRIWDFAMKRGCLPSPVFQQMLNPESKLFLMYKTGESTILEPGEIDDCYHACIPLCNAGKPAGVLAVRFSEREKSSFAAELAKKLGGLYDYFAGSSLAETAYRGDFLKAYLARELLLYDGGDSLLSEMYPIQPDGGGGEIASRFQPEFCIAAIRTLDSGDTADELSTAESHLPAFIPRSVCLIRGQILLVMLFGLEEGSLVKGSGSGLLTQLEIFVRKYHLYCGLSSVFGDLSQRRNYRHQAIDALDLGSQANPAGYLFRADELYTEIMLSEAVKRAGKQILTVSDVTLLAEYDAKNQTSYLKTLEQYLRYNNRITAASKSAFIDRGTMKYRLQKIRELLQADFDQPETAKLLRLGIAVYNLGKKSSTKPSAAPPASDQKAKRQGPEDQT